MVDSSGRVKRCEACGDVISSKRDVWGAGPSKFIHVGCRDLYREKRRLAVADVVLYELRSRKGFGGWWGDIDPETQTDIRETIGRIIEDIRI